MEFISMKHNWVWIKYPGRYMVWGCWSGRWCYGAVSPYAGVDL